MSFGNLRANDNERLCLKQGAIMKLDRGMNSIDEIIELYRRDIDETLLEASLRRTVEERILALEEFERFREELHAALERQPADEMLPLRGPNPD
jgi:hypothetical protein